MSERGLEAEARGVDTGSMASAWLKYDPARCWVSRKTWIVSGILIVALLAFTLAGAFGKPQDRFITSHSSGCLEDGTRTHCR